MSIILVLLIGVLTGYLADKIIKFGLELWQDILSGLAGGVLGAIILAAFGTSSTGGLIGGIIIAIAGACLVLWVWAQFDDKNNKEREKN